MEHPSIHNCADLISFIDDVGFLPLLSVGITGWSADDVVDDDCRYIEFPDGGWEWKLWEWKGTVIQDGGCAYGKFFGNRAGFVSRTWWRDFCTWRRSKYPYPDVDSIEEVVLQTLKEHGNMVARDLRTACGLTGKGMRGKFDSMVSHLQMGCYIVTEDFVYPHDKHGHPYGWGWSLLTTPERLLGEDLCKSSSAPTESHERIINHLKKILPNVTEEHLNRMI